MSKPKLIIRTLEDSPEWLDQQLVSAHLTTKYWVGWPDENGCFLEVGQRKSAFTDHLEQLNLGCFAIITASNPRSVLLEELTNKQRHLQLYQDLITHTTLLLQAKNISYDGSWPPESGFCACGIDEELARLLGQKYEQHAIVWWKPGKDVVLWWL